MYQVIGNSFAFQRKFNLYAKEKPNYVCISPLKNYCISRYLIQSLRVTLFPHKHMADSNWSKELVGLKRNFK
jgi:hypothetical protein